MARVVHSNRFTYSTSQLADQYYHVYNTRLRCAREALIKRAQSRWIEVKNVPLEQLNSSLGDTDVFVIGTLFKKMPKQRSILRELEGDDEVNEDPTINYTCAEDSLILHETDENVELVGDIDIKAHVTGIPVALLGHQLKGGAKFHVSDICYSGPDLNVFGGSPSIRNTNGNSTGSNHECLLIVSGLEFELLADEAKILSLKKLRNFILGRTHECGDINGYSESKVVKIIVAGNSIAPGYTKEGKAADIIKIFDRYLFELAQSGAEITLMPGKNDPSSFLIPQQPFHPKLLPISGKLNNLHPTTNPCSLQVDKYLVLGTAGENVDAIRQHSNIEDSTTVLKNSLEWGHIAPSAPDNLSCLPFKDRDPLVLDFVPDVYFAGNQPEFAVTTYSSETKPKIQFVSVPRFAQTQSCVLVDLSDLEITCLTL